MTNTNPSRDACPRPPDTISKGVSPVANAVNLLCACAHGFPAACPDVSAKSDWLVAQSAGQSALEIILWELYTEATIDQKMAKPDAVRVQSLVLHHTSMIDPFDLP